MDFTIQPYITPKLLKKYYNIPEREKDKFGEYKPIKIGLACNADKKNLLALKGYTALKGYISKYYLIDFINKSELDQTPTYLDEVINNNVYFIGSKMDEAKQVYNSRTGIFDNMENLIPFSDSIADKHDISEEYQTDLEIIFSICSIGLSKYDSIFLYFSENLPPSKDYTDFILYLYKYNNKLVEVENSKNIKHNVELPLIWTTASLTQSTVVKNTTDRLRNINFEQTDYQIFTSSGVNGSSAQADNQGLLDIYPQNQIDFLYTNFIKVGTTMLVKNKENNLEETPMVRIDCPTKFFTTYIPILDKSVTTPQILAVNNNCGCRYKIEKGKLEKDPLFISINGTTGGGMNQVYLIREKPGAEYEIYNCSKDGGGDQSGCISDILPPGRYTRSQFKFSNKYINDLKSRSKSNKYIYPELMDNLSRQASEFNSLPRAYPDISYLGNFVGSVGQSKTSWFGVASCISASIYAVISSNINWNAKGNLYEYLYNAYDYNKKSIFKPCKSICEASDSNRSTKQWLNNLNNMSVPSQKLNIFGYDVNFNTSTIVNYGWGVSEDRLFKNRNNPDAGYGYDCVVGLGSMNAAKFQEYLQLIMMPCLNKGTLIKTKIGSLPIESLKIGDKILNQHLQEILIKDIKKCKKDTDDFTLLKKNKLGKNNPSKDLVISNLHILKGKDNKLYLPKTSNKFRPLPQQEIEFYHIETDNYNNDWFIANNCLVETFTDGKSKSHLQERMKRLKQIKQHNKNTITK